MSARDDILTRLHQSRSDVLTGYTAMPDAFTEKSSHAPLQRFTELAEASGTTVVQVDNWDAVTEEVSDYLEAHALPPEVFLDNNGVLEARNWSDNDMRVGALPVPRDGCAFVSGCLGAVAENGTVVVSSAEGAAVSGAFLAQTHIVILLRSRIYPGLADLWAALRDAAAGDFLPREFCLIAGPSRTADLGVPAKLGAHGPARVHVIVVAD